jgi:single-strand DNA-binding protein
MANGLNQCTFCGNLGADPELRYTQSGRAVLNFRIACSEPRKQQDGSWGSHTEWVPITVWGNRAEGLNKFLAKGHTVVVVGKMRTTKYQDRNGQDRWKTEIHADEVIVPGGSGGSRNGNDSGGGGGERRAQRRPQREQQEQPQQTSSYPDADYGPSGDDDDIPF